MSTELSNFGKELKKMLDKITELVEAEIEAENKPKYPDDTFGQFGVEKAYGYLKNTNGLNNKIFRYQHKNQEGEAYYYASIECFTPLPEAILPHPVENDGTCPWQDGDEVRVELSNGAFETDTVPINWAWRKNIRLTHIVRSWLIKRAGE